MEGGITAAPRACKLARSPSSFLAGAALCAAAAALWIYGVYDRADEPPGWVWEATLALLAATYAGCGLVLGLRAVPLVTLLVLLALPAGPRDGDPDQVPVWLISFLWATVALSVVLASVLVRVVARSVVRHRRCGSSDPSTGAD